MLKSLLKFSSLIHQSVLGSRCSFFFKYQNKEKQMFSLLIIAFVCLDARENQCAGGRCRGERSFESTGTLERPFCYVLKIGLFAPHFLYHQPQLGGKKTSLHFIIIQSTEQKLVKTSIYKFRIFLNRKNFSFVLRLEVFTIKDCRLFFKISSTPDKLL